MDGIVTLILANIVIPGAVTGVIIAIMRGSGLPGLLTDFLLGAVGGVAGGLIAMRILARMQVVAAPNGAWMIWLVSAGGAVLAIAIVRSIARMFTSEPETVA